MKTDTLEKRQRSEQAFHDRKLAAKNPTAYYADGFTQPIFDAMLEKIEPLHGKKILEIGCGTGWMTKVLASRGAEVWAFDISQEAVEMARDYLAVWNLSDRTHVDRMAAERLVYDPEMFDHVVGKAILHHLDLDVALLEINRVLRSNGRAVFMEPLGHNPFLNLYRRLTPHLRSPDENPMRLEQIAIIERLFSQFEHEEYYFITLFGLVWHFLGMKRMMLRTRDVLLNFDRRIVKMFPQLRKYCWYTILTMEKGSNPCTGCSPTAIV